MNKIDFGLNTVKNGFKNEHFVVNTFNNWQNDSLVQSWLKAMNYNIKDIQNIKAQKIERNFKVDVQVVILVQIKLQNLQDVQNIQVKLVSNVNRDSLKIGKITMQGKGGDNGRISANMLQFKINSFELFTKIIKRD
ncbi:hypothetical protein OXW40_01285 [Campylobacter hepaticus]|nr:hypothetical protein [Campylobacter hepaticus]MDX2322882.1 hypothetical protein [Campylobacter hepaticus]MDX2331982.1 hypothetical protein [Campylobacter hepaticus]MDX2409131.1 hypothetical protein [Campylobacter hepaticus]